ncbi:class I SAM-dependent methyltransferase [Halarcobacter sp.]|uniref:class I SAM-dependent methyltransferase n=1 Tax=Halarcobacter sp. TaxID=2321133 RepID=UPI002AAC40BF|nr:class I SAM-dependent methyltransferase [Halarcobacter sp.]
MNLDLGKIQFYWRMVKNKEDEKCDIPAFLDFEFTYDQELNLIKQNTSDLIMNTLEEVYKYNYNVGYLQDGHDLAEGYANDFLNFFIKNKEKVEIKSIFEIGCGGGYLLKKIKDLGEFKITCLDPSPVALKNKEHFDVVSSFYPCEKFKEKVDLIIHYDVLEHIDNPVEFLNKHKRNLQSDGYIMFAVPDCSEYLEMGDISMVLHEHINYFDKESLELTVQKAGFSNIEVEQSKHGGVLYCFAQNRCDSICLTNSSSKKFIDFKSNYESIQKKIDLLIKQYTQENKQIGFYVPLRALPYISKYDNQNFRFFDDDSGIHKKYFDGFDIAIENFNDLSKDPTDVVFVMSCSFGEKIKDKILSNTSVIKVITLKDIFND